MFSFNLNQFYNLRPFYTLSIILTNVCIYISTKVQKSEKGSIISTVHRSRSIMNFLLILAGNAYWTTDKKLGKVQTHLTISLPLSHRAQTKILNQHWHIYLQKRAQPYLHKLNQH
jgi:hypothetical protein